MSTVNVTLALKNAGFKSGLDSARADVKRFKQEATAGGGLMGKLGSGLASLGLAAAVRSTVDWAGSLQDTSDALGLNVEQLQGFRGAFAESGTSAAKFDKALGKLVQKIEEAKTGVGPAREAFDTLGVSLADLQSKSTGDVLLQMADGFQKGGGKGAAFAAVMETLGKSGLTMAAGMKDGAAGVQALADAVSKISTGEVAALDALGDSAGRAAHKLQAGLGTSIINLMALWDRANTKFSSLQIVGGLFGMMPQTGVEKDMADAITRATAPKLTDPNASLKATRGAEAAASQQLAAAEGRLDDALGKVSDKATLDRYDKFTKGAMVLPRERIRAELQERRQTRMTERADRAFDKAWGAGAAQQAKDLRDPEKQAQRAHDKAVKEINAQLDKVKTGIIEALGDITGIAG